MVMIVMVIFLHPHVACGFTILFVGIFVVRLVCVFVVAGIRFPMVIVVILSGIHLHESFKFFE